MRKSECGLTTAPHVANPARMSEALAAIGGLDRNVTHRNGITSAKAAALCKGGGSKGPKAA
jgi:hypothetical protein